MKRGLIMSCQALSEELLHSSFHHGANGKSRKAGRAIGIRANSVLDILEIKE